MNTQAVCIVQARMGSQRLPGKTLEQLCGRPMLGFLLDRLQQARELSSIVVATSTAAGDDAIESLVTAAGLPCTRGPENDVLARFVATASRHVAPLYVRVCADNPFTDAALVDHLVRCARESDSDLVYNHRPSCGLPDGVGAEAFTAGTLARLDSLATELAYREHVTLYAYEHREQFHMKELEAPTGCRRPDIRLDVDYPADLTFVRQLCAALPKDRAPFWSTSEIIDALERRPELLKLRYPRAKGSGA